MSSKEDLVVQSGLSYADIDDRVASLQWALRRQAEPTAQRVQNLNLWVATIPQGIPPLRVFLRPGPACRPSASWFGSRNASASSDSPVTKPEFLSV